MATELGLQRPPTGVFETEQQEREALNRVRAWLAMYNLEQVRACLFSTECYLTISKSFMNYSSFTAAAKFGKPVSISDSNLPVDPTTWFYSSKYNLSFDMHLCGYTVLLQLTFQYFKRLQGQASLGHRAQDVSPTSFSSHATTVRGLRA